jgi:predicted metal-dependent phosphoesterase TrpH
VRLSPNEDAGGPTVRTGPDWFAGDLHSHSGHSDGRTTTHSGAVVPVPAHRVFDAAHDAGLDFMALTDHNTIAQWLDVDRFQPYYEGLLLLHGREITTYEGHANAIGEQRFHDFRVGELTSKDVLAAAAADGAFVSTNHPRLPGGESSSGGGSSQRHVADWCAGRMAILG